MLEFCNLYSGSSGNCLFVRTKYTKVLIDCGTSYKKICDGLSMIGESINNIDAIMVTHEHSDHVQSLGLRNAMPKQEQKILPSNKKIFLNDEDFFFNDLTIHPFSTPHDAANPCGFSIHNGKRKISIATDLGHIEDRLLKELESSSFILLESNYDPEILKVSKYPFPLKQRIAGPNGHLSNSNAGKVISILSKKELKQVTLGHLSKENNFPELAYQTVVEELMSNNVDVNQIKINVANRQAPGNIIKI